MFTTLEAIRQLPDFEYNGFKLGDKVEYYQAGVPAVVGYLVSIEVSFTPTYGVAFEHNGLYAIAKELTSIRKQEIKPEITVQRIQRMILALIGDLYMNQMEVYGTMTFEELDLDSLDLIDIISKVEGDLGVDIDLSAISVTESIDAISDRIYKFVTL